MAGYDNGTSFWENMNICAWLVALIDGIVLGSVLLDIGQECWNGKNPGASLTMAIIMAVILVVSIFFIWFSVSHMKKYPHIAWMTFPDFYMMFVPFGTKKEERDSYCDDEMLKNSVLWKRFGIRFKPRTFCWGLIWSYLVINMCISTFLYYQNPYEPDRYVNRSARIFYNTEYPLSACYFRLVSAVIFLLVAIAFFCNVRDYLSQYEFTMWLLEFNMTCEELSQEFANATYYGNYVWCGEHFLFVRSEDSGLILPYDRLKEMEVVRIYKEFFYYFKIPQWTLKITDDKGEVFVTSALRARPFRDVRTKCV